MLPAVRGNRRMEMEHKGRMKAHSETGVRVSPAMKVRKVRRIKTGIFRPNRRCPHHQIY